MMFYNENVTVGGCTPLRATSSDSDTVDAMNEATPSVTIPEAYVCVWPHLAFA